MSAGKKRSKKIRLKIKYNTDKCFYCKVNIGTVIDHVIPMSKGGTHHITNLVLACKPCDVAKDNQSVLDFLNGNYDCLLIVG